MSECIVRCKIPLGLTRGATNGGSFWWVEQRTYWVCVFGVKVEESVERREEDEARTCATFMKYIIVQSVMGLLSFSSQVCGEK